jgi:spore coat protein U-like protein
MSSANDQKAQKHAVHIWRAIAFDALRIFVALALLAPPAFADTDTDSFDVTATVLATCDVTAQDLAFGNYNPIAAANLDASTTLSVTCTNGTPYTIGLSLGDGTGASVATRYMKNGANQLSYTLYRDSLRTLLWGQSSNTLAGTGTGSAASVTVYGRVPMQQAAPAGGYSDIIVVTVEW